MQSISASSSSTSAASNSSEKKDPTKTSEDVYDEDYFSSGSEDDDKVGGVPSKSKQRRELLTNEELFYDPEMDNEDEKWVTKQREINANKGIRILIIHSPRKKRKMVRPLHVPTYMLTLIQFLQLQLQLHVLVHG